MQRLVIVYAKTVISILVLVLGSAFTSVASAAEVLSMDDFSKSAYWIGLGVTENINSDVSNTNLGKLRLSSCAFQLSAELSLSIYENPKAKYTRAQIAKIAETKIFKNENATTNLIKGCVNSGIDSETLSRMVAAMLNSTRPLTDIDELRGNLGGYQNKTVRFKASGVMFMDMLMVNDEKGLNPIQVNIESLSKDEKTQLYKKCGKAGVECKLELWGVVDLTDMDKRIIAKQVDFYKK